MQGNVEHADPSTCSAAAAAGSQDGQDAPPGLKDVSDPPSVPGKEEEGHTEQGVQEVPKKSSRIRFRKKSKQAKKQRSKGLFVSFFTGELNVHDES